MRTTIRNQSVWRENTIIRDYSLLGIWYKNYKQQKCQAMSNMQFRLLNTAGLTTYIDRIALSLNIVGSLFVRSSIFILLAKMCDHKKNIYLCGHSIYKVLAWCIQYQQRRVRCDPNPVK